jgi:hypothetical protein
MIMGNFDYGEVAELFTRKHQSPKFESGGALWTVPGRARMRSARRNGMSYRRFETGAQAIRFAVEELPAEGLAATVLEMGGERFYSSAIRSLYDSAEYPLPRRACARAP